MNTEAFVYIWVEKSTNKYYIGSRTKKGCNPYDGYICSSKIVKPLIVKNPDNWTRTILYKSSNVKYIRALEAEILTGFDVKTDKYSYNQHNGDGKYSTAGFSPWNKGKKMSDDTKKKLSLANKGRVVSEYTKKKLSLANKGCKKTEESIKKTAEGNRGKKRSEDTKKKMSDAKTGKYEGIDNPFFGKNHTEESRRKMSNSLKGRNVLKTRKPINQYTMDGVFVKKFNSVKDAKTEIGTNLCNISLVIKGKRNSAHGFIWKYA